MQEPSNIARPFNGNSGQKSPTKITLEEMAADALAGQMYEPAVKKSKSGWDLPKDTPSTQGIGYLWGKRVLSVVIVTTFAIWGCWLYSRPTLESVRASLQTTPADSVKPQELFDIYRQLQTEHFSEYRTLSELLIGAVYVPLFTLAAGYALRNDDRVKTSRTVEDDDEAE
jgi:hypothetical protein